MRGKNVRKTVRRTRRARVGGGGGGGTKRSRGEDSEEPKEPEILPPPAPPSAFISQPPEIPPTSEADIEEIHHEIDLKYNRTKRSLYNRYKGRREESKYDKLFQLFYDNLYFKYGKKLPPINQFKVELDSLKTLPEELTIQPDELNVFDMEEVFVDLIDYSLVTNRREHAKALLTFIYFNYDKPHADFHEEHYSVVSTLFNDSMSRIPFLDRIGGVQLFLHFLNIQLRAKRMRRGNKLNMLIDDTATKAKEKGSTLLGEHSMDRLKFSDSNRYLTEFLSISSYPDFLLKSIMEVQQKSFSYTSNNKKNGIIYNVISLMIYMIDPKYSNMFMYMDTDTKTSERNGKYTPQKLTDRAMLFLRFYYSQSWDLSETFMDDDGTTVTIERYIDILPMYQELLRRIDASSSYLRSDAFGEFLQTKILVSSSNYVTRLDAAVTTLLRDYRTN